MLYPNSTKAPVHANLDQCIEILKDYRPKKALLIGMGHYGEHHEVNRFLRKFWFSDGLDVQLARDGQFEALELLSSGKELEKKGPTAYESFRKTYECLLVRLGEKLFDWTVLSKLATDDHDTRIWKSQPNESIAVSSFDLVNPGDGKQQQFDAITLVVGHWTFDSWFHLLLASPSFVEVVSSSSQLAPVREAGSTNLPSLLVNGLSTRWDPTTHRAGGHRQRGIR
eukprot:symbB.v1.2.037520.t1/scaffold5563.1/size25830/1